MSNRHRSSKKAAPGAAHPAPSKQERRALNRRVRHRTHEMLAHADEELGEDLVPPRPHHTRVDLDPAETDEPATGPRREYRHWKQKFWKRRNKERAAKARLASQEPPMPDVG